MTRDGDGVVYVATGSDARAEAHRSLLTVREHSPGLGISVFTDEDGRSDPLWGDADHRAVIEQPYFSYRDKVLPLLDRPFQRSLFLDADTIVRRPLEPLFELLDGCDVAATHDVWRTGVPVEAPDAFPEPNTGVILLADTSAVDELITRWDDLYGAMVSNADHHLAAAAEQPIHRSARTPAPALHDQPAFRLALWHAVCDGEIRFATLPAEVNLRLWGANALAAGAMPWIVHSHAPDVAESATALEQSPFARVWLTGLSGGMGGRLSDEVVVGGDFGPAVRRLLGAADACRSAARRVVGSVRRGR